jgi:hypothetical protein
VGTPRQPGEVGGMDGDSFLFDNWGSAMRTPSRSTWSI